MPTLENKEEIKKQIRWDFNTVSEFARTAGMNERELQYLHGTLNGLKFYACMIPILEKFGYNPRVVGYRRQPKKRAA